ncbi:MAG: methionyl-tRNA formyltransferase, partial [Gammaproteobacteria bacterium]|nr:methionyl-tRNA formyltransferase [Gammaproteobacteria bacterium]
QPDVMVVVAYGLLLPAPVLVIPRLGCINVHASLLPRWRGAAPIQRALLAGDRETGVTLMQMDQGLDTGAILAQAALPIEPNATAALLHDRLAEIGAATLIETLDRLQRGTLIPVPQDERQAVYAAKINKAEARLDWSKPALALERAVRAFNPWPVAYTSFNGTLLRVWQAQALDEPGAEPPGRVTRCSKQGIEVATGQGVLRLLQLQLPGGRPLSAAEFLNAHTLGSVTFS